MSGSAIELFLSDEVQALLDDFAKLLDIRVTFFSVDGKRLRRGKEMPNCEYCQMVQNEMNDLEKCIVLDTDKQAEALQTREVVCYRCHAGLYESIAPIFIRGKLSGYLMIGQFRVGDVKPEEYLKLVKESALRKRFMAAFNTLPVFSAEKFSGIVGMLRTLIDYIAVRELAVLKSDRLRTEIDNYIQEHAREDIRLSHMAKRLGRSVSTISQFLRREYKTNFKNLLISQRMHLAEQFWKEYPEATVCEVAFASGFSDQFYFSRVFHNKMGMPPREYREKLRNRKRS